MSGKPRHPGTAERQIPPRAGVWDVLLAEDETELDPELLAAFVAGRLDPQQHEAVRQLVARSPKAMDMVDALYEFLEESRSPEEPQAVPSTAPDKARPAERAGQPRADRARSPGLILALAASLLLAVLAGYLAIDRERIAGRRGEEIARLDRAILGMPVVSGSAWVDGSDPAALLGDGPTFRGLRGASPEEEQVRTTGIDAVIEAVDRKIGEHGETAGLLNLRAAAYIARGQSLPFGGDAERDRQDPTKGRHWYARAEADLRKAVELDRNYAPARFNLALVLEDLERPDEAKQMWNEYLQLEQDEDLKTAVQERLRGLN